MLFCDRIISQGEYFCEGLNSVDNQEKVYSCAQISKMFHVVICPVVYYRLSDGLLIVRKPLRCSIL